MAQLNSGPNVYIEEVPSSVHTITGVATSIAAFVDFFPRGDLNFARRVQDFGEFTRLFGGLHAQSEASYAIQQFFANGGTDAWVVRTASGPVGAASVVMLDAVVGGAGTLRIDAINPGQWGNGLRISVDPVSATTFNLGIQLLETLRGERVVTQSEVFRDLSRTPGTTNFVGSVVNDEFTGSKLIRVTAQASVNPPQLTGTLSGALAGPINLTNTVNPQLSVTIGTEGSGTALLRNWGANPGDIGRARALLEAAIRAARPENQAFSQATVSIVGNALRVLAGPTSNPANTVTFATSTAPLAGLLALTPAQTFNGMVSADLAAVAAGGLNGTIDLQIGAVGPIPLNIAGAGTPAQFRDQLEIAIRGANAALDFTAARVGLHTEGAVVRVIVIPGTQGGVPAFTANGGAPALAGNVVLATAAAVTLTGNLAAPPVVPNGSIVDVSIGGGAAHQATTVGTASTFALIGTTLQAAIRAADANVPFTGARVAYYSNGENTFMVLAGDGTPVAFTTTVFDGTTVGELLLDAANAESNVQAYQLNGVAVLNTAQGATAGGNDGTPPSALDMIGDLNLKTGLYALERVDLFNILCLPRTATKTGANPMSDAEAFAVISAARDYCARRRAFFIVDTPDNINSVDDVQSWMIANIGIRHRNLALYFPRVQIPDPLDKFRLRTFGASGTVAGIYARVDGTRGVWKAPAGIEATLDNVTRMSYPLTDLQTGILNPLAINCLRTFTASGNLVWGARTLVGTDAPASEWKYVPVRRFALFLEETLFRGTTWVVFEPNDEPLWAKIRLNLNAFMMTLFRQGAFQGSTPTDAFRVKCDAQTTTQADRDLGIVNIEVSFAPLKPAEFVVIKIQQIAGDL